MLLQIKLHKESSTFAAMLCAAHRRNRSHPDPSAAASHRWLGGALCDVIEGRSPELCVLEEEVKDGH